MGSLTGFTMGSMTGSTLSSETQGRQARWAWTEGDGVPREPEIAQGMRYLRNGAGWTQAELATRAGVNLRALQNVELGREHRPSTARKIATALGLDDARWLWANPGDAYGEWVHAERHRAASEAPGRDAPNLRAVPPAVPTSPVLTPPIPAPSTPTTPPEGSPHPSAATPDKPVAQPARAVRETPDAETAESPKADAPAPPKRERPVGKPRSPAPVERERRRAPSPPLPGVPLAQPADAADEQALLAALPADASLPSVRDAVDGMVDWMVVHDPHSRLEDTGVRTVDPNRLTGLIETWAAQVSPTFGDEYDQAVDRSFDHAGLPKRTPKPS